ncbi:hypothetical protein G7054_g11986 [Neopestalotiopsis clavispora]|nr:hypothetical protein G7054_g11986 [Neopestalotiopsis clavispora]
MAEILKPVPQEDLKLAEKSEDSIDSGSHDAAAIEHNPALDRKLLWRRDLVLIPIMGVLYMLLFLDRTNIANARALGIGSPNGLEGALGMPSNGYNIALVIFYVPFVLAEIPANIILTNSNIPPRFLLGGQMVILGILGMCQGLTKSYGGLLAVRFLMGTFEAALPAGATYMISTYYTKREAAIRFSWFFNFALAGPFFSGLLAYAINNIDGAGGYQGWRWIFIIEGLMTVAIAIPIILFCPNFPQQAQHWFLKPDERDRVVRHLEASRGAEVKGSPVDNVPLCVHFRILSNHLDRARWTNTVAQLMTMPVWASGIVSSFTVTYLASRFNFRTPFVIGAICCQLVGWIIMRVYVPQPGVRYLALFFMSIGTFPQMPIFMAWLSANLRGHKYLAVGMAWMVGFGNCANFISSNVFIKAEAPKYVTGFTNGLVFTIVGMLLTLTGCGLLVMKNKKRDATRASMTEAEREAYDDVYFKFVL